MLKVALVDCPRDPYCARPTDGGGQPSLLLCLPIVIRCATCIFDVVFYDDEKKHFNCVNGFSL